MSDSVNEYGLGTPNTQNESPVADDPTTDPLAHGLGARDVADDEGHDSVPEGGRRNHLEHGMVGAGPDETVDAPPNDPLRHGLGTADRAN